MHKHQCLHKISFSKRNSGITWLASLTSCVSRDGSPLPPVNDQIFNILRLFCTTLCLSIDVTWANVFLLVEIANYANASCKPGGQWGWHFSSHNTPVYSLLQIVHRHIIWLIYFGLIYICWICFANRTFSHKYWINRVEVIVAWRQENHILAEGN